MCFSGVGVELKSVNFLLRITESLFPTLSFEAGWHGDFMFSFSSEDRQTGRSLSFNLGMTTLSWRFMQEMRRALISASCCDSMSSELLLVEYFLASPSPLLPFLFLISVFLGSLFALSLLPFLLFTSSLLPSSSSSTSLPDDWLNTVTNIFPTKYSFSRSFSKSPYQNMIFVCFWYFWISQKRFRLLVLNLLPSHCFFGECHWKWTQSQVWPVTGFPSLFCEWFWVLTGRDLWPCWISEWILTGWSAAVYPKEGGKGKRGSHHQ